MVQKKCYEELKVYEIMYSKTIKKEKNICTESWYTEEKYEEKIK